MRLVCVLFICLVASASGYGAEPDVKLRLKVQDVYVDESEPNEPFITGTVTVTILNVGKRPALLFTAEAPTIVSMTLAEAAERTLPNKGLVTVASFPSVDTSAKWSAYAKSLEGGKLAGSGLTVIPVGGDYHFSTVFNIPASEGIYPKRPTLAQLRSYPEVWLSIGLHTWPGNLERVQKSLGRKMRNRWRGAGDLMLEPLVAEPVCLGSPGDWTAKKAGGPGF